MPPKIVFGVNLNFAKYVYGRKRVLEVVRRRLGLCHVEMVADNDFGAVFYVSRLSGNIVITEFKHGRDFWSTISD